MRIFKVELVQEYLMLINSYEDIDVAPSKLWTLLKIVLEDVNNYSQLDKDTIFDKIFEHFFLDHIKEYTNGKWQKGWSDWKGMHREKYIILPDETSLCGKEGWSHYFSVEEIPFVNF